MNHAIPEVGRGLARYVLALVDQGLCSGPGNKRPGQMCVEAAVSFAMGGPLGSYKPSCVSNEVNWFMVALNDYGTWKSDKARAEGLRRLSIAQLGSDQLPRRAFTRTMIHLFFKEVLIPHWLKKANVDDAKRIRSIQRCKDVTEMEKVWYKIDYLPGPYSTMLNIYLSKDHQWYKNTDEMAEDMIRICAGKVDDPTLRITELAEKALKKAASPGTKLLPLTKHQYTLPQ